MCRACFHGGWAAEPAHSHTPDRTTGGPMHSEAHTLDHLPARQLSYLRRTSPVLVRSLRRGIGKPTILGVLPSFPQKYRDRVKPCPLCGGPMPKSVPVTFWSADGSKHLGHTLCRAAQLMHDADRGGDQSALWADELARAQRAMSRNRDAVLSGQTYRAAR